MHSPCSPFREDMVAYLDRELPAARTRELEGHLQSCPECRAIAEEHREVWRLLDHYEPVGATEGFLPQVLARAGWSRPSRGAAHSRISGAWLAAAAVLLVVLIPFGFDFFHRPPGGEVSDLSGEEWEAALNIDLLQNLDLLRTLDVFVEVDDPALLRTVMDLGDEVY